MHVSDLLVVAATAIAWWSLIPQIRRLTATGDASGVSSAWPAVGFVTNASWTAYLLSQGLWPAAPSAAVMTIFYVLVIRALVKTGRPLARSVAAGAAWATAIATAGGIGGWPAIGMALGVSYAVQFTPAIISAFRSNRLAGISTQTWFWISVEASLWGTYGWVNQDRPIVIYGVAGVLAGLIIIGRTARWRQQAGSESSNRVVSPSRR